MKKGKKNLFYFAGTSFVILSVVVFLPASVSAQGYSTMSNPWLESYGWIYSPESTGQMSSTTTSPRSYTQHSYTKSNPASTPPMYGSYTQTNPVSTPRVGGGSTNTLDINQDTYFHSGWVDTMVWYRQSLDLYGWKPGLGEGSFPTSSTCFNCGSGSITSLTCGYCGGITFVTCAISGCREKKEAQWLGGIGIIAPGETYGTCNLCGGGTWMTCGGYSSCGIGVPEGKQLPSSAPYGSFNFSSNFPSQPPVW